MTEPALTPRQRLFVRLAPLAVWAVIVSITAALAG
jgi:hypothetical protein